MNIVCITFENGIGVLAWLVAVVTFLTAIYLIVVTAKYLTLDKKFRKLKDKDEFLENKIERLEKAINNHGAHIYLKICENNHAVHLSDRILVKDTNISILSPPGLTDLTEK